MSATNPLGPVEPADASSSSLVAAPATPDTAAPTVRQATLLARLLAETMIANVQRTAALNLAAADALLAHARLPRPPVFDAHIEGWRMAWRSFEICATTTDHLLGLTRGHVERSTVGLWRVTERLLGELGHLQAAQLEPLRHSFNTLREAQDACFQATQLAHQSVIALAQTQGARDGP